MVEGYCYQCNEDFEAHWNLYPDAIEAVYKPYCRKCGGTQVQVIVDEIYSDYEEETE